MSPPFWGMKILFDLSPAFTNCMSWESPVITDVSEIVGCAKFLQFNSKMKRIENIFFIKGLCLWTEPNVRNRAEIRHSDYSFCR